jgi:hypothetical protein
MSDIININDITPSKASLAGITSNLTIKVMDGEEDPIKKTANLDFIIKACTNAKEILKPYVITELEKDKLRTDYHGYKIEICEAGVSYDYSNCNDSELEELTEALEIAKEAVKQRQDFLKTIKGSLDVVQDGEAKTIYSPVRKSTTTPKLTLK